MTVTIQVSDRTAHRLMGLCEKAVKDIGSRLALEGMKGLSSAAGEIREVAELIAKLEAAGVRMRTEPRQAPEPTQTEPELPLVDATASEAIAASDAAPGAEPDDAPPAAVIAARKAAHKPGHTNGSKQKWQRVGGAVADRDAESGPG